MIISTYDVFKKIIISANCEYLMRHYIKTKSIILLWEGVYFRKRNCKHSFQASNIQKTLLVSCPSGAGTKLRSGSLCLGKNPHISINQWVEVLCPTQPFVHPGVHRKKNSLLKQVNKHVLNLHHFQDTKSALGLDSTDAEQDFYLEALFQPTSRC